MSGIYIHIPFCKKACHYCNFHFSTNLSRQDLMVAAICKDIEIRQNYLVDKEIQSLYFGGGTPSILSPDRLLLIKDKVLQYFTLSPDAEITIECNPDDLSLTYLQAIKAMGFNRLSIGIQSFFEDDLIYMNRAHNAEEAEACIALAKATGFDNITIDLIYGSPSTSMERWQANVAKALAYDIGHISSYCLTIEDKTVFGKWLKTHKMQAPDEIMANAQFEYLIDTLVAHGYDHYEISNFGKPGKYAVHNTNYWKGIPYLGVGPSAHSYNGNERSWSLANNALYITALEKNTQYVENEILSKEDMYNEYVIGLRTMWGINLETIKIKFGDDFYHHCVNSIKDNWLSDKIDIAMQDNRQTTITLTKEGKYFADRVASLLFI
jgi:oxygen-independent coproporphyrinogen III oxidase